MRRLPLSFKARTILTAPVDQSDMLAERLKELGVDYEYLRIEGYPHTLDIILEANAYCRRHIYRFLDKYLRRKN